MTCAAYQRRPLGDGTLRPLSAAAAAAAGSAANSSKIGRNRSARSVATGSILCLLGLILPAPNGIRFRQPSPPLSTDRQTSKLDRQPVENEDQSRPWHFLTVVFLGFVWEA
jgi:hypothetical protein